MFKISMVVLGIFLFNAPFSYAKDAAISPAALQAIYGQNYNGVDIEIKYAYKRKHSQLWKDASFSQKEEFLKQWHQDVLVKQKQLAADQKIQDRLLRDKQRSESDLKKVKNDKIKKEKRRLRDIERANKDEKEAFEDAVKERTKRIDDLRDASR